MHSQKLGIDLYYISSLKVIIKPSPGGSELPVLYDVVTSKGWTGDKIKLKIAVKMDKPVNLKKCG